MSFAALALHAWATNDTMRAQINNIPLKCHVIPLLKMIKNELNNPGKNVIIMFKNVAEFDLDLNEVE